MILSAQNVFNPMKVGTEFGRAERPRAEAIAESASPTALFRW